MVANSVVWPSELVDRKLATEASVEVDCSCVVDGSVVVSGDEVGWVSLAEVGLGSLLEEKVDDSGEVEEKSVVLESTVVKIELSVTLEDSTVLEVACTTDDNEDESNVEDSGSVVVEMSELLPAS